MQRALLLIAVLFLVALRPLGSLAFETKAPVALVMDVGSGMVLLDKGGSQPIDPASMAKIMTIAVILDAMDAGEATLGTRYEVSEFAWRTGGAPSRTATMFAALKSRVAVIDLLRGAMIQGANDACLILAEGLAGSEAAFVERMNAKAAELGLTGSRFVNATGLPAVGQAMTARDLAIVSRHLLTRHRAMYGFYGEGQFTWNKVFQRNRNPLLSMGIGADGLATGTAADGTFGLVGSAERGDRRVIVVVAGLTSAEDRAAEARRLIEWGFDSFAPRRLFESGTVVGAVRVFGGASTSVSVATTGDVVALMRTDAPERLTARIAYRGPLAAPVAAGGQIGDLEILRDGETVLRVPVATAEAVPVGSIPDRAFGAVIEFFAGLWHRGTQAL